jgi:peroxiredoxin
MAMKTTDGILWSVIVLGLGAMSWLVADTIQERIIDIGDTAPKFSITSDSGRNFTRADFGGKVLVLNFWATWCPPCVEELPSLNAFQKQFADKGVVVLGVSVDKNADAYRQFLSRTKVDFQIARDPEANISASYGTFKYPETYIINREGKVVQKIIGPTNWTAPEMITAVRALL